MAHHQKRGQRLRHDAGNRHAVRRAMADNHKEQIQNDIQHARNGQIKKRLFRFACRAEYAVAEIINRHNRHAQRINLQI